MKPRTRSRTPTPLGPGVARKATAISSPVSSTASSRVGRSPSARNAPEHASTPVRRSSTRAADDEYAPYARSVTVNVVVRPPPRDLESSAWRPHWVQTVDPCGPTMAIARTSSTRRPWGPPRSHWIGTWASLKEQWQHGVRTTHRMRPTCCIGPKKCCLPTALQDQPATHVRRGPIMVSYCGTCAAATRCTVCNAQGCRVSIVQRWGHMVILRYPTANSTPSMSWTRQLQVSTRCHYA